MSFASMVYLAGPGVFRPDAVAFGEELKRKCREAGLTGLFPLDNVISESSPLETARAIYDANVQLLDSCLAVVAEISPFRGPNMDPGTAWEIGYAVAKKLPIFAWSTDSNSIIVRTRGILHIVGSVDADGWTIEDFGLQENLMISASVESIHNNVEDAIRACARNLLSRG